MSNPEPPATAPPATAPPAAVPSATVPPAAAPPSLNRDPWTRLRGEMPVTRTWAYLDHAAVSPLPERTRACLAGWLTEAAETGVAAWSAWMQRVEDARRLAARLIDASPEEIAFIPNTTTGLSLVAEGIDWRDGDNVVLPANEFPSNAYPWMNLRSRGVTVRFVPTTDGAITARAVSEHCDQRTRVVAASWVGFGTGYRIDPAELAEVAHRHGAYFVLDAIQGLGVFPLAARDLAVDFLAADGHKWLLGPEGAGLLFVRREHLDRLRPLGVGWHSVEHAYDYSRLELRIRPDAARYEGGSLNMAGILALGSSLELLSDYGLGPVQSAIADRVHEVCELACEKLRRRGAEVFSDRSVEHRSGIVSFGVPNRDPQELRKRCLAAQVALSCRGGRLRISPHAYCVDDDFDRLIAAIA